MTVLGRVRNGVIELDEPLVIPEGSVVRVDVMNPATPQQSQAERPRRTGGQWKGQVRIAPDFDVLPADLAEAFGMPQP